MRRGELVARLVAAVVRPCSRAVVRSADGPALAPSRRARVRGRSSHHNSIAADALRCGRRRPRQAGAARGAVFESMRPVEGRLRAFALRLRCSALSSSPAQQRLRAQFKLSIRRVCTSLVIYVAIYAGPRRACDHLSNRDVASKLFCLKSSVRSRIRLRSADARLGRPWPWLGGMADQAAPGHRGRAAQFRARLGRRARFLIAVHCCARWLHARMRAHSVCKQTLREPQMSRPARALISALSRTPRASLGTLSSRPKTLGRLKDVCAS